MTDHLKSSALHARSKLNQIDATTPAVDAERTARLIAKGCERNDLATLLAQTLTLRDQALAALQDAETQVFVCTRAAELQRYRDGGKTLS